MKTKKQTDTIQTTGEPPLIRDIAHPGALPPASATTRPVIVTNRPLMQDPMMVPAATDAGPVAMSAPRKISPLTASQKSDNTTVEAAQPAGTPFVAGVDNDADGIVGAKEQQPLPTTQPTQVQADDDGFETPEFIRKRQDTADDKETADALAAAEIEQLVEQEAYFLPINAAVQRRSRNVSIFGSLLILVLLFAWLNIAMDAGFVTIPGFQSLTHLFSN